MTIRRRQEEHDQELTAALDELEVRFLLDPDTTFDDEPTPPPAQPDPPTSR